jgi:hypothetical protein
MRLSPHDEHRMDANTEEIRRGIEARARKLSLAKSRSRDYIDMQLQIMRRH